MQIKLEEILSETKLGREVSPKEFNKKFSRELKKINGELKRCYAEAMNKYKANAPKDYYEIFSDKVKHGKIISDINIKELKDELDVIRKRIIHKHNLGGVIDTRVICDKIVAIQKTLEDLRNKIYKNEYINKE